MSRGLGRLQRFFKDQIYRAEREYRREGVILFRRMKRDPKFDPVEDEVKNFWLTWPEIRSLIEENPDFKHGPYRIAGPSGSIRPIKVGSAGPILDISTSLERSAKRALYLLVKRSEIARLLPSERRYLTRYTTKETEQRLNEGAKAIMEGFARMAKKKKKTRAKK